MWATRRVVQTLWAGRRAVHRVACPQPPKFSTGYQRNRQASLAPEAHAFRVGRQTARKFHHPGREGTERRPNLKDEVTTKAPPGRDGLPLGSQIVFVVSLVPAQAASANGSSTAP